jgi:multiple sugar transport system permease protein
MAVKNEGPISTTWRRILRALTYAALVVLGTIFSLPFLWLLITSFKPAERIQRWPPDVIPRVPKYAKYNGKSVKVYVANDRTGSVPKGSEVIIVKRVKSPDVEVAQVGSNTVTRMSIDDLEAAVKPGLAFSNYTRGLVFIPFFKQLRNTLVICLLCVIGSVLSCSLVAYGLSRIDWKGRDYLFILVLSTMMLPPQVTMIPIFSIFVKLGWIDTFLPLVVPSFLGNAFFIFLLRQFFLTIPKDLSEAATLDGCSEFITYLRVILPLSKPALAMVGLWAFMGSWNDFMGPLIYLMDESRYTLSLGLQMFLNQYGSEYGMLMAVSTVVTVPIIILFFFTQRTFIQGITLTGMKG